MPNRSRSNLLRVVLAAVLLSQGVLPWAHLALEHGRGAVAGRIDQKAAVSCEKSVGGHADCRVCEMVRSGAGVGVVQTFVIDSAPMSAGVEASSVWEFVSVVGFTSASPRGPPSVA